MAYVTLPDRVFDLDPKPSTDVTPSGYNLMSGEKAKGTSGNDKATLTTLQQDKDQVISMGDGDDIFSFGAGDEAKINGIVHMGDGGNDIVYLNHQVSDYEFTIRSDGGIKIHYIGSGESGAAVTFYGADNFVFRNIDDQSPYTNYKNDVWSHDDLYAAIATASDLPLPV